MVLNDRMKRILKFSNITIILISFFLVENLPGNQILSDVVKSYYSQRFSIHSKDIKIKFIHIPDVDINKQYLIVPELKIKLGHQTIWIEEHISGNTFPLTLDISANIPVLVAKKTIPRKEGLAPEMFYFESCLLTRDYERYVFDKKELEGAMAIQVIKMGKPLTYSMIKKRPDIFKGDLVGVELVSGNMVIETKGTAKKDGNYGGKTEVILDRTGKKVFGKVIGSNRVRVKLN
ncbi:MAG: flagella basal body P-ring formation protein FlgA [Candidatus Marinimicrobia bacterium]|nr:flagella basal body P-ring formation protein FlgA [Candidatus Neomarinimicrobiota bacterium]|tara:strand:+ start:6886 stop:7584 length:699 start_codon:yes stop_codon:yes gene_type:complete